MSVEQRKKFQSLKGIETGPQPLCVLIINNTSQNDYNSFEVLNLPSLTRDLYSSYQKHKAQTLSLDNSAT